MPIHDWSRVRANRFHDFHQGWTVRVAALLNSGLLPDDLVAMITSGPEPDVVTLSIPSPFTSPAEIGGVLLADHPPSVRIHAVCEPEPYAAKANRIVIRHPDGEVIAVIEVVSPGNKSSRHAIRSFAEKAAEFLRAGVHLLVVDLFPPTPRDPQGVHKLIWDEIQDQPFELPPGKPFTLASYSAGFPLEAFVDNIGVGDSLPDMPLFIAPGRYIPCPLETTYQQAWDVFPKALKPPLETAG